MYPLAHIVRYSRLTFSGKTRRESTTAVKANRANNESGAQSEDGSDLKTEQKYGTDTRYDNCYTCGESFENIVGVLHHEGHHKSAESLVEDDQNGGGVVAVKEAESQYISTVVDIHSHHSQNDSESSQLDISEPG